MTKKKLFEEFPPVSSSEWKEKVVTDLKGADFDKKLVWNTPEGFSVLPWYRSEDLKNIPIIKQSDDGMPHVNRHIPGWKIRQDINNPGSVETCNKKILKAIEKGAQTVGINMRNLKVQDKSEMTELLSGIDTLNTELVFSWPTKPLQFGRLFIEWLRENNTETKAIKGALIFDPLEVLTLEGELSGDAFDTLASMLNELSPELPGFRLLQVNPGLIQDGGGTLSQELGFGLSMANEYLDKLSQRGIDLSLVTRNLVFSFVSGPDYFMEIAKLRAARILWSAICKEWRIPESDDIMHIHTRSASWNLTIYDPNVNMLRTTTEAMSASLGGSDEISVLPFDHLFKEENDFTNRIARNIQVILKEEAYFDKVADPAAGSYYIEQLTHKIGEQSWKVFTETEKQGCYTEAFKSGYIPEQVAESAEGRLSSVDSGRHSILGVNQYPNFSELILSQYSNPEIRPENINKKTIHPIRVASGIEQLRLKTEKSKKRPKVFLLKYGDPKWMTARAMFAGNFFACAGYEIIDQQGAKTIHEGIDAARNANADIVVLCSSDEEYPEIAPIVQSTMGSNAEVVIAGYPTDSIDELKEKGIQHFIHVRSNLLGELQKFQSLMNIES